MSTHSTRIELVACFSQDLSAGLRGGAEYINVSFSGYEMDSLDIEDLCKYFCEFFNADAVVAREVYERDTLRQAEEERQMRFPL